MNTFFFVAFLTVLVSSVFSSPISVGNSVPAFAAGESLNEAIRAIENCSSNICFALDGSGSVNSTEFGLAKSFIQSVSNQVEILPGDAQNGAVQFGKVAYLITLLTTDLDKFNQEIESENIIGDSATSVGAGIVTCDAILSLGTASGPNRIVIITDGRNSFGGNPVANADIFRAGNPANRVTAIGIGNTDPVVLQKIAGPTGGVFTVKEYTRLFSLVGKILAEVC